MLLHSNHRRSLLFAEQIDLQVKVILHFLVSKLRTKSRVPRLELCCQKLRQLRQQGLTASFPVLELVRSGGSTQ